MQITREQAIHELKRRAAMQSLAAFIQFTKSDYLMGWVHREICETLDAFLQDVIDKKSPRLIICMPPRSGKSEIVSRRFPAYAFGRFPDLQIIATSYGADLSMRMNRDVQRIIDDDIYREVFPDTTLSGSRVRSDSRGSYIRTSDLFEIVGHSGAYRSCGVGGGITGQGSDILLIDDPIKDRADANSTKIRQAVWDWYTSTAYTRLSPGGGVIAMCTRWHMDDLIGRLETASRSGSGDPFHVINYPAIAERDEPHRKFGEALHPERYPIERLEAIKRTVGSRDWAALYQQHPVPDGGGLFKADWIQHWDQLPSHFDATCISWDMTFKDSSTSDFVVGQVWGRREGCFYLLDQFRGRWDFVKTAEQFVAAAEKWPKVTRKLIEDKANGPAIISTLKRKVPGIVPVTPKESKEARASAVSTLWEARNVYLPPSDRFPWVEQDFIPELLSFPGGAHDDQCFAAGTMIATPWGSRPIEKIQPGDFVLTPFGFKRVLAAGKTGEAETIKKFSISATRNHPFFTKQGSFKKFCQVTEEECSQLTHAQMLKASRLLPSFSMGSNTDCCLREGITLANLRQMQGAKEPRGCTSPFGSDSLVRKFLKAMRFITKTATRSTMILATLSVYHAANIAKRSISRLRTCGNILMTSGTSQLVGIKAQKGASGIENTQNSRRVAQRSAFALVVGIAFWLKEAIHSFAHESAKSNTATTTRLLPKSESVLFVVTSSQRLSAHTDIRQLRVAESAKQSSDCRKKQAVFNLMVEDAHCFYANGMLVHNCDAMTQALSDLNAKPGWKIHSTNRALLRTGFKF